MEDKARSGGNRYRQKAVVKVELVSQVVEIDVDKLNVKQ